MIAGALSLAFVLEAPFGATCLVYVTTMVAYTLVLKRLVLLDVFAISAGFVLRAVAGAAVIQVPISPWLYICTGLGALFIALAKRRSELALAGDNARSQRHTLKWYFSQPPQPPNRARRCCGGASLFPLHVHCSEHAGKSRNGTYDSFCCIRAFQVHVPGPCQGTGRKPRRDRDHRRSSDCHHCAVAGDGCDGPGVVPRVSVAGPHTSSRL